MHYTVNKSIIYNPADGSLTHIESGDLITLPLPAQRLLQILLDSEGKLISREDLLSKVWEQYGLNGSGNNLNQYLSIIRRSFSSFGCEWFIETIPRVGVRLFESVMVIKGTDVSVPPSFREQKNFFLLRNECSLLSLVMIGAALLMFLIWCFIFFSHDKTNPSYITQSLEGGCQLVTFLHLPTKDLASVKRHVNDYMKMSGEKCEPGVAIYFDNISSQNIGKHVRTLISVCDRNNEDEDAVCSNTYYINGVADES